MVWTYRFLFRLADFSAWSDWIRSKGIRCFVDYIGICDFSKSSAIPVICFLSGKKKEKKKVTLLRPNDDDETLQFSCTHQHFRHNRTAIVPATWMATGTKHKISLKRLQMQALLQLGTNQQRICILNRQCNRTNQLHAIFDTCKWQGDSVFLLLLLLFVDWVGRIDWLIDFLFLRKSCKMTLIAPHTGSGAQQHINILSVTSLILNISIRLSGSYAWLCLVTL